MISGTRRYAIALGLGLCLACAAQRDAMRDKLELSTRNYTRAMRWGDWETAAQYVPEESFSAYLRRGESLRKKVEVVDHELLRLDYAAHSGTATARYQVHWQRDREIVIRDSIIDEKWVFFEGRWYIVSQRRVSGAPMELIGEAVDPRASLDAKKRREDPVLPGAQSFLRLRKKEVKSEGKGPRNSKAPDRG